MTNVFMESDFEEPIDDAGFEALLAEGSGCFSLYRVEWQRSCLAEDGRRMICWFTAPDAESMRQSLRKAGASQNRTWPGTVHDAPGPDAPAVDSANVVVERSWQEPVTLDEIQAIEDKGTGCLETHNVKFVRTYFSTDRRRMVCLYRAPDAEAVRLAQRQAKMPVDLVWSFRLKTA
jgi:hypothetical protein